MVWTLRPPGVSMARANRRRASARRSLKRTSPVSAWSLLVNSSSERLSHSAKTANSRPAISAAAARVKVRHRMRAGGAPASIRRTTRATSTWVFPEPALAETKAESAGSEARQWWRPAWCCGSTIVGLAGARLVEGGVDPFAPARQVTIAVVALMIVRNMRVVGLRLVAPGGEQAVHAGLGGVEMITKVGLEALAFTWRIAAGETEIDELADGGRGKGREAAAFGNDGFEQELRGEARGVVVETGNGTRLVIDEAQGSVGLAVDAVGAGGEAEKRAIAEGERDRALELGEERDRVAPQPRILGGEPFGDLPHLLAPEGGLGDADIGA